jgi:hypothetical protein
MKEKAIAITTKDAEISPVLTPLAVILVAKKKEKKKGTRAEEEKNFPFASKPHFCDPMRAPIGLGRISAARPTALLVKTSSFCSHKSSEAKR